MLKGAASKIGRPRAALVAAVVLALLAWAAKPASATQSTLFEVCRSVCAAGGAYVYSSPEAAEAAMFAVCQPWASGTSNACGGGFCAPGYTCTVTDDNNMAVSSFPSYSGTFAFTQCSPVPVCGTGHFTYTISGQSNGPSPVCSASGTHTGIAIPSANWSTWAAMGAGHTFCNTPSSTGASGGDDCSYTTGNPQQAIAPPGGSGSYLADAYSTGQQCQVSGATSFPAMSTPPSDGGNASAVPACADNGGMQSCNESVGCGTFNGDEVCVQAVPSGSCVAYPSGGTACVSTALPKPSGPAPNNGTSGVAATPDGGVIYGSTTINYFDSATTAASTTPPTTVSANNGGKPTGTGGNVTVSNPSGGGGGGGGSVTVSGTVATTNSDAAADGDCSAGGCSGTTPAALSVSGLSYDGIFSTFWSAVQSAPLVSSLSGLGSSFPAGSCDVGGDFTLSTVPGHTFNYGTTFCSVWNTYAAPSLSVIALAAWSIVGIFILMSA